MVADADLEIGDLVHQRQAIRAHMKFLIDAMSTLGLEPESGHIDPYSAPLKDRIGLYRWPLFNLREAIKRQMELAERTVPGGGLTEGASAGLKRVQEEIDDAMKLADSIVYNGVSQQNLEKYSLSIADAVNKICAELESHLAETNGLVKQR